MSYHEATLLGISCGGSAISLALDDVFIDGTRRPARVTIEGVRSILRDGSPIEELRMEYPDGEILSLRQEDGRVLLVIEWNDFAARRQEAAAYSLVGGWLELEEDQVGATPNP